MYTNRQKTDVENYGDWFSQWNWHMFGTFTFGRVLSESTCNHHWNEFELSLQRYTQGRVGWIRATELRWSGCGKPHIPLHFNALLAYENPPAPGVVEAMWWSRSGQAKVEIYDPERGASWYIAKMFPYDDFNYEIGGHDYLLKLLQRDSQESQPDKSLVM